MQTPLEPPLLLIVGASGQLGRAIAAAAIAAGWRVRGLVRRPAAAAAVPAGVEVVVGDGGNPDHLVAAARGAAVIVHAANPGYAAWREQLPVTDAVIVAARATGATIVFPGNVYGYGAAMPKTLTASTPAAPTTSFGSVRVEVEQRLQRAAENDGVQVIILRLGSFFGGGGHADWFSQAILKDDGVVVWPTADLQTVHAWSFVPDAAATLVRLAAARASLPSFAVFCCPGLNVSGAAFLEAIDVAGDAVGQPRRRRKTLPWTAMALLSPFIASLRPLRALRYLWQTSHALVDDHLADVIGPVPATPLTAAVVSLLLPRQPTTITTTITTPPASSTATSLRAV